jgi:hypothetical protein
MKNSDRDRGDETTLGGRDDLRRPEVAVAGR